MAEIDLKKFGNNVRKYRLKRDMTQADLGWEIERDMRSIVAIEAGRRNTTIKTIHKLCKVLRASASDLLGF